MKYDDLKKYEAYMRELYPEKFEDKYVEYDNGKIRWVKRNNIKIEHDDFCIEITTSETIIVEEPKVEEIKIKRPPGRPRTNKKRKNQLTPEFKKLREVVLQRDNYMCTSCHTLNDVAVHHIIHRKHGGKDELSNLATLCEYCHYKLHENEPIGNVMRKRLVTKGQIRG